MGIQYDTIITLSISDMAKVTSNVETNLVPKSAGNEVT